VKPLLADIFPDRIDAWGEKRSSLPEQFKAPEISLFFSMEFVDPALAPEYEKAVADFTYNIAVNNALRTDLASQDFTEVVSTLTVPVLIVHGRYDAVIAPSVGWALAKTIPTAEIEFIEQSGHLPFVERPAAFVDAVDTFLADMD
jgi:pimeloyl-ACP methyl ester carboxylesterase